MFAFINNRLELKIVLTLTIIIACVIGAYTYYDIKNIRKDAIHTSELTLGAFASAIKGGVIASMKTGHHEDVRRILDEVNTPYFISRVMIYSEEGRPLRGVEKIREGGGLDVMLPPDILRTVGEGDKSDVRSYGGNLYLSYYSAVFNQPECYRCHSKDAKLNGILRVDFSLHDLEGLVIARRNRDLFWSSLLAVLLTTTLVILLRILVYRPVKELRDAMARVQAGEEQVALPISGSDELSELKKRFLDMLHELNTLHHSTIENEKKLAYTKEMTRFRQELQGMFDAMPDGVLLVDPDMKIVQSNPRIYELLPGLKEAEGRISEEMMNETSSPHRCISTAFHDATICEHQCSVKHPDGQVRYVHSICAPVIDNTRTAFVVEVIRDITERVRTERELEEKTSALTEANKALALLASTDKLTQLCNRHSFDEIFSQEIKRCSRQRGCTLSVLMLDIDHFKDLNDRYGHLTGDSVLREIAALLKYQMRDTDIVARYGGEEFVIVMPSTDLEGAVYKAEVLRHEVERKRFSDLDDEDQVTISIGVSAFVPNAVSSPHALIHAADQALYEAKKTGRNRVAVRRHQEEHTRS